MLDQSQEPVIEKPREPIDPDKVQQLVDLLENCNESETRRALNNLEYETLESVSEIAQELYDEAFDAIDADTPDEEC